MEDVLHETGLPAWLPPSPEAQSVEAAAAFARFIWTASTRTSRQTLSNCLLELIRVPSVRHEVMEHPELIPALIEEVVRLDPGEHLLLRETTEDAMLPTARIPGGAPVMLCLAAANRDPARFERPHEIWLQRPSNPHFGFGKGHHKCPGANIARAQVAAALRVWLRMLPEFEAAEPLSSIRYLGGTSMRILDRLMVRPWPATPAAATV
jgi:cytochrome P450